MGASGWSYITAYGGDLEAAVAALHARVFEEEYGDGSGYESLEELHADEEFMGTEGTHSILDVDHTCLSPLAPDRLLHHFGTERPTVAGFEERVDDLLDECPGRWTGCYVLLHPDLRSDSGPTHLGIVGISGD
ncbi:hypothetical protein [Kitasatospora sp. NPDC101183]|uniref:hypothetical protein n=1 Tax=Kitasatospora sp. NPDC101183 TaxID=3364100 RepID=UPI00381E6776